jgi:ABC-type multidrug transport system fused ATPase/permease subunit
MMDGKDESSQSPPPPQADATTTAASIIMSDDDGTTIQQQHQRPSHPYVNASFLSKLLFIWPYHLMSHKKDRVAPTGASSAIATNSTAAGVSNNTSNSHAKAVVVAERASIEECDLPDVLPTDTSETNLHRFQLMWEAEQKRAAKVKEYYVERYKRQLEEYESGKRDGDDEGKEVVVGSSQRRRSPPPPPLVIPKAAYPSLHRALVKDFLWSTWYCQPCMLASSTARLVQALALGYLLQTFESSEPESDLGTGGSGSGGGGNGYLWVGVLVSSGLIVLMEHHHVFFWTWRRGMQYRISCIAAIYDKSLRLNSTSATEQLPSLSAGNRKKTSSKSGNARGSVSGASSGKIVNLATNDVERFMMATLFASYIIWAPLQSLAILGLGWWVIGWSFAAGFGLLLFLFVPLQLWLSKRFAYMRSRIAAITDERVTMVSQAVSGVRVMKISGWEDNFQARIASIRKREVEQIEHVNIYRVLNEAIFFVCNVTTSVCIFLIHVGSGGVLTPRNVFTTMVLINVAQMEITKHLSLGVMGVAECWVSISRIQRFLETPELEQRCELLPPSDNDDENGTNASAIIASHVTCHWNGNGRSPSISTMSSSGESEMNNSSLGLIVALDDVSVEFRMGSLTCVIGAVGSGKSALIQMLAGELPLSAGSLHKRNGSLAYAPQDPWIMDGTIRENILLGREFKSEHYSAVVNACGLDVDIVQLRDGEDSVVGDRGVQLSGGQVSIVVHSFHFGSSLVSFCDLPSFVFPDLFSVQELPWQGHSTKMPTSFSWMIRFRP